jgi:hypothetical protein
MEMEHKLIIWKVKDKDESWDRSQFTRVSCQELDKLKTEEEKEEYIQQCVQKDIEKIISFVIYKRKNLFDYTESKKGR